MIAVPFFVIAAFAIVGIESIVITHNPQNPVAELSEEVIEDEAAIMLHLPPPVSIEQILENL